MNFKNRKAAIEMSMNTIVTIVLVVVTLILALVLIRTIFTGSTNAVNQINTAIQDQINQLFTTENTNLAIYPNSRQITLTRGSSPAGFAFSVKNPEAASTGTFTYTLSASDVHNCGSTFTMAQANAYILGNAGTFTLGPGNSLDLPILVEFDIPSSAPKCTIIYDLNVLETAPNNNAFPTNIFVTLS
jgi:archaellum component FlaG (FlaF/FlaG flagellin family)